MYRDTLFSSATQHKHSWIPILYLYLPSFLLLEFEWCGEQLLSDCSQENRQDNLKEGDLVQVCKILSTVDGVNRQSLCSFVSGTRSRGLQMKLTGVTSEQKWLQTPWVVILCSFLLQNAAVADILFEFKKGPDRLMEENIDWGLSCAKMRHLSQEVQS